MKIVCCIILVHIANVFTRWQHDTRSSIAEGSTQ